MANGDVIVADRLRGTHLKMIDAAGSTSDGAWIDASEWSDGSIHVVIATTATVQVCGSNAATKPANSTHGYQIGSDITASAGYDIDHLPRWVKARVSAWTAGQVDVLAWLRPIVRGV